MKWTDKQRQQRARTRKTAVGKYVKIVLEPKWVRFEFDCDKLKILSINPHCSMMAYREIGGIIQSVPVEDGVECVDLPNNLCIPALALMNKFMPPDEGIGGRLISIYEPIQKAKLQFNSARIRLPMHAIKVGQEVVDKFDGDLTIYGNNQWSRRSGYADVWTPVKFKVKFRICQGLVDAVRSLDEER